MSPLSSNQAAASVRWPYRAFVAACRLIALALGFRVTLEGAEHLPRDAAECPIGGWIAAALPHRTWVDPFVLMVLLPPELRLVWLVDGPAVSRSWWRRLAIPRLIEVVPIRRGGGRRAFAGHLGAVDTAVRAGKVFVLFPEVGPPAPVERARPLAAGLGYMALRTGAPIVPLVIGGGHELYLRRRLVLRVLPPIRSGGAPGDPRAPWTRADREAAGRIVARVQSLTAESVAEAYHAMEPGPRFTRRWRWLTDLFQ